MNCVETEVRIARNESVFRGINERQAEGHARFELEDAQEFVCECGDIACSERLRLTLADYERVRSHPRRFIVVPGHDIPAVEAVAELRPRYAVVEKQGRAGEVAEAQNPPHAA